MDLEWNAEVGMDQLMARIGHHESLAWKELTVGIVTRSSAQNAFRFDRWACGPGLTLLTSTAFTVSSIGNQFRDQYQLWNVIVYCIDEGSTIQISINNIIINLIRRNDKNLPEATS